MNVVRHQLAVCREGWNYLFVLGFVITGSLLRDINLLVIVAGMMVGPLIYSYLATRRTVAKLRIQRHLPDGVCAGDLLVVNLELKNRSRRQASWAVTIEDSVAYQTESRKGETAQGSVLFTHVPPGESRIRSYSGRATRRGKYQFGRLKYSTRFPLGLIRRTVTLDAPDEITVYPRLGRLTPQWRQLHSRQTLGSRRTRRSQGMIDADFYGLRDWRPGDSQRWIHWRTSARRGSLVVRQFEQQRSEDLLLLVDLWQPKAATPARRDDVELAISFAATAAADVCRQGGSHLCVGVGGKQPQFTEGAASAALQHEIMELLALAAGDDQDRLPDLLVQGLQEAPASATIVVVSTRPVEIPGSLRYAEFPEELYARLTGRRIHCIDASSAQLDDYYAVER